MTAVEWFLAVMVGGLAAPFVGIAIYGAAHMWWDWFVKGAKE